MSSEKLQKLRISRRCYSLLNRATVPPENLKIFYRTYRLPEDPFFPLFLSVKKSWIDDRRQWRENRISTISVMMEKLPARRRENLQTLAELERNHHPNGRNPVWNNVIYPKSKKRAGEMAKFGEAEWQELASRYLTDLGRQYQSISEDAALLIEAKLVFGFDVLPERTQPGRQAVQERFRILSKEFHPDRGGDGLLFRRLKTARDVLQQNQG
jgi:hypothetical protein